MLLWVDRPAVRERLQARRDDQLEERLAAWEQERDDLLRANGTRWFDLGVDTTSTTPKDAALRIDRLVNAGLDDDDSVATVLQQIADSG